MSPASSAPRGGRSGRAVRGLARLLAAAGPAADAAVHARLAGPYDAVVAGISQGVLFRVESGLAALAALLVLVWRHPRGDAFALLVAAGGLAVLVLYTAVGIGQLGPVPDMYYPVWTGDKKLVAASQIVTVLATGFLLLTGRRRPAPGYAGALPVT
ncbi:hypothetical protein CG747_18285 [Streptomyces sp. CB02959]|uniref:hypothetical protein n=1 Tax=Streptomyces sp. CB02959 TaxID=2020330 RepID=UPI000C27B2F8|nr:hypothetical protein [Streptomyces sp. CB02959]PJN39388.1 hypothetical protein CG747_18285 [Streptomyces sp. CB02959]